MSQRQADLGHVVGQRPLGELGLRDRVDEVGVVVDALEEVGEVVAQGFDIGVWAGVGLVALVEDDVLDCAEPGPGQEQLSGREQQQGDRDVGRGPGGHLGHRRDVGPRLHRRVVGKPSEHCEVVELGARLSTGRHRVRLFGRRGGRHTRSVGVRHGRCAVLRKRVPRSPRQRIRGRPPPAGPRRGESHGSPAARACG